VPGAVLEQALVGSIVPLLSDEIMTEYEEVLRRKKFPFKEEDIQAVTDGIRMRGVFVLGFVVWGVAGGGWATMAL